MEKLQPTSATCASVALTWHAANANMKDHPVVDYEVSAVRADGSVDDRSCYDTTDDRAKCGGSDQHQIQQGITSTSHEMTGLLPSTGYFVRVRARAEVGYGPHSAPVTLTTTAATRAPEAPFSAPKVHDGGKQHDCSAIELRLPTLRPGCGGDERLTIEMSEGGAWLPAAEDVKGKTTMISALDPYAVYRFRAIAINGAGSSKPGVESSSMVTDPEHANAAPTVTPTSSASFEVSWLNSPCRPQVTWEVNYARHDGSSSSALKWQSIAKGVKGSAFEVQSLRCPSGCVFRVRPLELKGFEEQYSKPSALVRTHTLPRAPEGAKRLELKLTAQLPSDLSGNALSSHIVSDLASALDVPKSRVNVVEVRRQGLFFIFDLLEPPKDGDGFAGAGPTVDGLVARLSEQIKDEKSALFTGSVTRGVDPSAPPLLVAADGTVSPLDGWGGGSSFASGFSMHRAAFFASLVMACVAVCCVCSRVCAHKDGSTDDRPGKNGKKKAKKSSSKKKSGKTYGEVGASDDDDFDDDFDDDIIERESKRLDRRSYA